MQKAINFKTTRAIQISTLFVSTLIVQWLLNFSKAGWIGFAVMMIYVGFDSGTSLQRTFHRFWGAMLGLFLSIILFLLIRLHDEFIFFVVPVIVFFAFFSLGKPYFTPTIFTVTLTALGSEYYSLNSYSLEQFFFDYAKATTIALCICIIFEYFIFKKQHLGHHFHEALRNELEKELNHLFTLATQKPRKRSHYFKQSLTLQQNFEKLNDFVSHAKHDYHMKFQNLDQSLQFDSLAKQIYDDTNQLFILGKTAPPMLQAKIQTDLQQLSKLQQG